MRPTGRDMFLWCCAWRKSTWIFLAEGVEAAFFTRLCLIAVALFSDGSDGRRIELILARNQNVSFGSGGNPIRAFSRVDIEGRDPC